MTMRKALAWLALILLTCVLTGIMKGGQKTWVGGIPLHGANWDRAENWSPPGVPTLCDSVTIPAGPQYCAITGRECWARTVMVSGELRLNVTGKKLTVCKDFVIGPGGIVTSPPDKYATLYIGGRIVNLGRFEMESGKVVLNGHCGPQTISGNITFHDLDVQNCHGAIVTDGEVYVTGELTGCGKDKVTTSGSGRFAVGDDPLPITLAYFAARYSEHAAVSLEWTTLSEIQNYGFHVQRRETAAADFENVGFVPGQGTTLVPQRYLFTDAHPATEFTEYRLLQQDLDGAVHMFGPVSVSGLTGAPDDQQPLRFRLAQNYPNPFNPVTNITFQIPEGGPVSLIVYDVSGKEVVSLVNEKMERGSYQASFDASRLASGVYFYRLKTEKSSDMKRMILLK